MSNMTRTCAIMNHINDCDLWEDLQNTGIIGLQLKFMCNREVAGNVELLIGAQLQPNMNMYGAKCPNAVLNMIKEALHQGLDGYTDEEKTTINVFLADIMYSISVS